MNVLEAVKTGVKDCEVHYENVEISDSIAEQDVHPINIHDVAVDYVREQTLLEHAPLHNRVLTNAKHETEKD